MYTRVVASKSRLFRLSEDRLSCILGFRATAVLLCVYLDLLYIIHTRAKTFLLFLVLVHTKLSYRKKIK